MAADMILPGPDRKKTGGMAAIDEKHAGLWPVGQQGAEPIDFPDAVVDGRLPAGNSGPPVQRPEEIPGEQDQDFGNVPAGRPVHMLMQGIERQQADIQVDMAFRGDGLEVGEKGIKGSRTPPGSATPREVNSAVARIFLASNRLLAREIAAMSGSESSVRRPRNYISDG